MKLLRMPNFLTRFRKSRSHKNSFGGKRKSLKTRSRRKLSHKKTSVLMFGRKRRSHKKSGSRRRRRTRKTSKHMFGRKRRSHKKSKSRRRRRSHKRKFGSFGSGSPPTLLEMQAPYM